MTVHPFIEAEEAAGHSVKNACRLLEVSKSAYYERRKGVPSARQLSDAELLEKIKAIHTESKGTYGAPRVHKELLHRHVACGKRKVTKLMRQAGLEGRCKKRWRKTTTPDPDAERARDLIQRHFGPTEEMDRRYVGDITYIATSAGMTGPRISSLCSPHSGAWREMRHEVASTLNGAPAYTNSRLRLSLQRIVGKPLSKRCGSRCNRSMH